ncbi:MAG: phosphotyrosine protein phosphatase [Acidobacteria bacterium]|nr:phosphotyrosine protein phosphatase [Acidobacteriota bacterium]
MRRLLFVCTANQHRSRTAEDLYRRDPRYEVRSAGTDVDELEPDEQPVTQELVAWADVIFVMEQYHLNVLEERFPGVAEKIVVLEIPDYFYRGDPELTRLLKERVSPHVRHA